MKFYKFFIEIRNRVMLTIISWSFTVLISYIYKKNLRCSEDSERTEILGVLFKSNSSVEPGGAPYIVS